MSVVCFLSRINRVLIIFGSDHGRCGNINWAKRTKCNICNTTKPGHNEGGARYVMAFLRLHNVFPVDYPARSASKEISWAERRKVVFTVGLPSA